MKISFRISGLIFIILSVFTIISCKKEESKIVKSKITGQVQKGPYVNGTSISMSELNSSLAQTGNVFTTQITNNTGSFQIDNISLTSTYVEFNASGYYFDEVKGDLSIAPLNLFALSDIRDISTVNVNIMTHLEKQRVDYLIKQNRSFLEAKKTAQDEILSIFGYSLNGISNSETLDISVNSEANAVLLSISVILQGNRSVGDLTELLANISNDIKDDGKVSSGTITADLRSSAKLLKLANIRSNLEKRYQDLGITATIPGFEKFVNNFLAFTGEKPLATTQLPTDVATTSVTLNGTINPNSLSTAVIFEWGKTISYGDSINAMQSPITGSSSINVSKTLTGLLPGTTYHFRVKTKNALGTTFGNDLTFTTLGQVASAVTNAATNITTTSATLNGTVNANLLSTTVIFEFGKTISYGDSISATQSPVNGSSSVNVSVDRSGLSPGTIYHFRVKAKNALGTIYSNDLTFTTLGQVPTVTTQTATNITTTSATLNGTVNPNSLSTNVIFEFGKTISYGDSISVTQYPINGSTALGVNADKSELSPNTIYHFRVKSKNSLGITYGNDFTFKTLGGVPVTSTLAATIVNNTGAILNATVNANYLITTVSFEYGLSTSYGTTVEVLPGTLMDPALISTVSVSKILTGLSVGTTYHYRVVAINPLGSTFGDDMTFTTTITGITGTINDYEGNIYKSIGIGSQIWMAENLKTTTFTNGDAIPLVTDNYFWGNLTTAAYCYYNNNSSYSVIYGNLYNYYTVVDSRNLCPLNWHIPSKNEWTTLITYLGGENIAGGKLKEIGFSNWGSPNTGATNESGFTAKPGGYRYLDGSVIGMGGNGGWWSNSDAWTTSVYSSNTQISNGYDNKNTGRSVRCIKD